MMTDKYRSSTISKRAFSLLDTTSIPDCHKLVAVSLK
jgi:hypothetical protein